jgi:hypothetical protein
MDSIMLDLETLATTADAVILSIGACKFDMKSGEIDDACFYTIVNTDQPRRHISPETLSWWITQSDDAQVVFTSTEKIMLHEALLEFSDWVDNENYLLWSNGADFDIPILNHALHEHRMNPVVKHYNHRCFRTYKNIFNSVPKPPMDGIKHNALADAIHQARWLIDMERFRLGGEMMAPTKGFGAKRA